MKLEISCSRLELTLTPPDPLELLSPLQAPPLDEPPLEELVLPDVLLADVVVATAAAVASVPELAAELVDVLAAAAAVLEALCVEAELDESKLNAEGPEVTELISIMPLLPEMNRRFSYRPEFGPTSVLLSQSGTKREHICPSCSKK